MADSTDPGEHAVADRLASLLRGEHVEQDPHGQHEQQLHGQQLREQQRLSASNNAAPSSAQVSLLRAARAEAEAGAPTPVEPQRSRSSKRSNVKKLASPHDHGRPGLIRRPAWSAESDELGATAEAPAVDPRHLPPPVVRKGFQVAGSVAQAHAPTEVFAGQTRQSKKARDRRSSAQVASESEFGTPTASQILDMRVPGKTKGDSPFLVPLVPSLFIAALSTYVWFQACIRLTSYLPLAPILVGVAIGGIMRLGTRSVDFARVIFAVLLTAFATFWGHAAAKDFGPLGELTATTIRWSDLPRVANPVGLISTFHATAEISIGNAALMFSGMIAAGLLSSLTGK